MARVTKINVGGTNYDIAHEGELKKSWFEVVTSLPTTGLYAGRQVFYKGQQYIYNGTVWCNQLDPLQKLYFPLEVNRFTLDQLNSMSQVVQLPNNQISQIPELLVGRQWTSVFSQVLKKSEFSCEIKRGDADWVNYEWQFWNYQYRGFSEGTEIRITTHNLAKFANDSMTQAFFLNCNMIDKVVELTIEYLNYKNLSGDDNINNEANYEWHTIFKKELKAWTSWVFPIQVFVKSGKEKVYARDIRLTLRVVSGYLQAKGLDFYIQTQRGQTIGTTPFLINYNSTIEPTQTGEVFKTNKWILQYLTQAVNWLKANNVRLSAYNTKVAALEQADSDNNASTQSVRTDLTELSNGLATVATSGSYNDLTDKPTFSGSYNDLTDKPTLFSGSYNDLTDKPTLATVATSGDYDDLLNKPALVFQNIGGTISSVQIPDGLIANAKLANSSMTLNGTTVNLGDTSILPWYVDYNEVDYPARIREHWLQIYRNGVWANLMYLGDILPTQVGQITSLDNLDWYNEQVSEYEVDSNTTTSILNGTTMPAIVLMNCLAEQLTLNFYPISGKQYGKGSLDSLITDLKGKGFSVFVENDLDAIQQSGSDYLVRLKISKVPTTKAIIECYVAR